MKKQTQIIFLIVPICLVIFGFFYSLNSETLFGKFLEQTKPINWDEVHPRAIIKNSIPIEILEIQNDVCKVKADKFQLILIAPEFNRAQDLARELDYNNDTKTITMSCNKLPDSKLPGDAYKLHVWFILEDTPKFPERYQYFTTNSNVTIADAIPPQ